MVANSQALCIVSQSLNVDLVIKKEPLETVWLCLFQASIQMEAMDCKGALQIGVDLLDRFGQGVSASSTDLEIC